MNKKGGISSSESLQTVIRHAALYISVLIAAYTFAFTCGVIVSPSPNEDPLVGYIFSGVWLLTGVVQFFSRNDSDFYILLRLSWYQIIAALYLTFVTGIASFPFIVCWMIIALASYSYYQLRGYILSITLLWIAALCHSFLYSETLDSFTNNLSTALAITVTMTVLLFFFKVQERDDEAFEKSRNEEKLQRESLLTLVNNLTDAIISTDENGIVKLYNAATVNLLDTNIGIENSLIDDILKLEDESHTTVLLTDLLKESPRLTVNDRLRTSIGGELVRLELTYSPIRGAEQNSSTFIIIMRDITKAKSLEEERDEFISVVSHELRTPIAITEGAIDNAQVIFEKDDAKKEVVKETLHMAHEQVIFLARMVNDLSTLSRAERGVGDEAELIDVDELVHMMYTEYAPQAEQKNLQLNLVTKGKLGSVTTSRLYLQELLQNFVTNAIKYTKDGHIDMIVEQKAKTIHFAVKDTGIGISRTDQQKIFDKFYRSEDYRTRETGGTGLGLYVAAKLAKKLSCKIEVKSRLNHGSTFSFSMPVHEKSKKTEA